MLASPYITPYANPPIGYPPPIPWNASPFSRGMIGPAPQPPIAGLAPMGLNGALNPYGFWDDAFGVVKDIGRVALPIAGQAAGSFFGQPQLGAQIGRGLSGLIPQQALLSPYAAGGLNPYGFWDDAFGVVKDIGRVALPIAGTAAGAFVGQPMLGGLLGQGAASLIPQQLLAPFAAGGGVLDPYGFWDDAFGVVKDIGRVALPIAGQAAGTFFGQPQLGAQLGRGLSSLIPQAHLLN